MPSFIVTGTDKRKGTPIRIRVVAADAEEAQAQVDADGYDVSSCTNEADAPKPPAKPLDAKGVRKAVFWGVLLALVAFALIVLFLTAIIHSR